MPENPAASQSRPWRPIQDLADDGSLRQSALADVCVIGAGMAGLMTAYELILAGKSVVVVEDGSIGSGETGNTTSHLASAIDDRYYILESIHGADGARLCGESHRAAIDRLETIIREESIDCEFRRLDGALFLSLEHDQRVLDAERHAAEKAGCALDFLEDLRVGGNSFGPALLFHNQGQMEPMRFLGRLAEIIRARGGRIHTRTQAIEIEDGQPCVVRTNTGVEVRAADVVIATNSPVNLRVKLHTKQAAYRTYVVAMLLEADLPALLLWDTGAADRGYHFVRQAGGASGERLLLVGGEDHRTGQADDADERWMRLETWARRRFRCGGVVHRWSGQVMEPVDGVAFIGRCGGKHTFVATGDSGMGMTHGAMAGMLLRDLITGRDNPWASLYDPDRISLRSMSEFLSENLNTANQYLDWARAGDLPSEADVAPGCGAIIKHGLKPVAVYRDEHGRLHAHSAVCTHLGGIVAWNSAAKSWDCPCHGSRFDCNGMVLNGPAIHPLPPVTLEGESLELDDETVQRTVWKAGRSA